MDGRSDAEGPLRDAELARREERCVEHLRFERFLSGLSARFVSVPLVEVEREIGEALRQLGEFLDLDRVYFARPTRSELVPTIVWHTDSTPPQPELSASRDAPWLRERLLRGELVAWSRAEDLPAEAHRERDTIRRTGVRSQLNIPLMVGSVVYGAIVYSSTRAERAWPEELVERLRLIGEVFANALARRSAMLAIEERTAFEDLVTELSASFVDVSADEVDPRIEKWLGRIGEFLGVELCTVMQVDQETERLRHSHQWMADTWTHDPEFLAFDIETYCPWLSRELRRLEPIVMSSLADFPREAASERNLAESLGIRSVLWVPFGVDGRFMSAVAINAMLEPRVWSPQIVGRLQIVARVFGHAIAHRRDRHELEGRLRSERFLAELSGELVHLHGAAIGGGVSGVLQKVGLFEGVDRVHIVEFHEDRTECRVSHWWVAEGIEPDDEIRRGPVRAVWPWICGHMMRGEAIVAQDLDVLPAQADQEKRYCEERGIRSFAMVPLGAGGQPLGGIVVDTVRRSRRWPVDSLQRLRIVGELISSVIDRAWKETGLRETLAEVRQLKERLEHENVYLHRQIALEHGHGEFVGQSESVRLVLGQVEQVAVTDSSVLILGETGTGKELVAQAIHRLSARRTRPMVKVNCAALPSTLVESELFGREKGAYTGALSRQLGRFELAHEGTIFLDEVAELPLELQAKLLRVLQDGEFERLGAAKTITVDVRVIAATNRDLLRGVREGRFREDLYYRLAVFPISMPPLRERREDIPALVWAFVREFGERSGKTIESIPRAAMEALQRYAWPGNVRELRNVIERAIIVSQGPTLRVDMPATEGTAPTDGMTLADVERRHIRAVLEQTGWRVRGPHGAAHVLGLKPTTLEARMQKLGIRRGTTPS